MSKRLCLLAAIVAAAVIRIGAQSPADEKFAGVWTGTWDGAGTGGFELTLEKPKDGPLGGRVAVTGEPAYKATFKTVSFDGAKMTATYDFPPDERAEIVLAATFDGNTAGGTWTLREKGSGSDVASGTWRVTKK